MKIAKKTFQTLALWANAASLTLVLLLVPHALRADLELPEGYTSGCPFVHEDPLDLSPILNVLKAQISAQMTNRNSCRQPAELILAGLAPLQDFRNSIDPATKEKIAKGVYQNALSTLLSQKLEMEASGLNPSMEYARVLGQISVVESSIYSNEIGLKSLPLIQQQNVEAKYRSQLLKYTSNILDIYNSTARTYPQCIGAMGGWSTSLASILGGVSIATGIGMNPTAQAIGAAIGVGAQLVSLLNDSRVRKSYNELVRMGNYKVLACTYFSLKRSSCDYKRAYQLSRDSAKLREFFRNRFNSDSVGEYERFFVNSGRVQNLSGVLSVVAEMGSPLTLDQAVISSYIAAKAVDFVALGAPPSLSASSDAKRSWLLKARTFGIEFNERNFGGGPNSLDTQLQTATNDLENKRATIVSVEALLLKNQSFIDLRRRLSSEFPDSVQVSTEMINYFNSILSRSLVPEVDSAVILAARDLLVKLRNFLAVSPANYAPDTFELEILNRGSVLFSELAKGAVAQLNTQSVLALGGKGSDRLGWAFGVIRNAYFDRDAAMNTPPQSRFYDFLANRNILSEVISNYRIFTGAGTTFRNEEYSKALSAFEDAFRDDFLRSLQFAMENTRGVQELKGQTAGHLCALYSPSLKFLAKSNGKAKALLAQCMSNYKSLDTNRIVSDQDFTIDYDDECSYFKYHREIEIQNILSRLIRQ